MLKTVAQIGRHYRVNICIIAHAGDGNLHPIIVFDDRDEEERARVAEARQELFRRALAAGGTLSGEHGIGLLKKRFMPLLYPAEVLATLGLVKRAFDPDCILNPGKVLEEESRHEGR
jgi:glycolate oxidase